jgi:uncharacterized protein YqhQ
MSEQDSSPDGRPPERTPSRISPTTYGGQAVMEGVMMRGRREMAVAVRAPSGEVVVWSEPLAPSRLARRVRPWPFVRGAILLADTLALGIRALLFSAAVSLPHPEVSADKAGAEAIKGRSLWLAVAGALLFAVGLFFVLPLAAMAFIDRFLASALLSNLVEGAIRLALLLGYVLAIGKMPKVRRVFGYHGAEHKAIHAWEAGDDLSLRNVRRHPLAHPRCGTGFLVVVMLLSLAVFVLLGRPELPVRLALRVLLVPVIAGIAYEFLKFGGRRASHWVVRALLAPGLCLQRITTREPDDAMLDVAVAALLRVLAADGMIGVDDPRLGAARRVDARGTPLAEPVPIREPAALAAD